MPLKHWKKFCKDDMAHIRAYPVNIFSPVSPKLGETKQFESHSTNNNHCFPKRVHCAFMVSQNRPPSHSSHKAYLPTGFVVT